MAKNCTWSEGNQIIRLPAASFCACAIRKKSPEGTVDESKLRGRKLRSADECQQCQQTLPKQNNFLNYVWQSLSVLSNTNTIISNRTKSEKFTAYVLTHIPYSFGMIDSFASDVNQPSSAQPQEWASLQVQLFAFVHVLYDGSMKGRYL